MKTHTRVAVIGGGVTGCSILYHLAKMGWRDVVLIERAELTAGSSWHAAGNLFSLTAPANAQVLQKYAFELYPQLEKEADQSLGFHCPGGMTFATLPDEYEALKMMRSRGRRHGIECDFISPEEAKRRAPIIDPAGAIAILWEDLKGYVDPASTTQAYAKAARQMGATIYRHNPVIETNPTAKGGWEIVTQDGTITADYLVNATGLWGREVAALAGIKLPLMPVEHHYLVTENIPEIEAMAQELPNLSDGGAGYYSRQEGKGILLGAYENQCYHWAIEGTPLDFGHELLPDALHRMEANFEMACQRMPCLAEAGVKRVVNGPMIFSPDLGPLLGPYPGLKNYFCANGVMTGFNQGAGIGWMLAEWIIEGEPSLDISFWDVGRFGDWAGKQFTFERTKYYYENRNVRPRPYEEYSAGRPVRTFPVYDKQKAHGAVFGMAFGWETPLWYAREGDEQRDIPSFQRANWFKTVGEECRDVRDSVGIFEVSTFAKYLVTGPGAETWLNFMLANKMPSQPGKILLSPMLSPKGKLIGDFTVSRLDEERFLILGAGGMQTIHMRWFEAHLPKSGVTLENLSLRNAGLMIAGPNAQKLLAKLAWEDVGSNALPFLSAKELEIGTVNQAIAARVSFTGELGYEIYFPSEFQRTLFDKLMEAGREFGAKPVGGRALMSLRLEKGFASWGADLGSDYSPYDCGLGRFVKLDKGDFVGREEAARVKEAGAKERFSLFSVQANGADAFGGEAIFRNGELAGYVTSGGYGHTIDQSLAVGYLRQEAFEDGADYEIEILGERKPAKVHAKALVDPDGSRMRA